MTENAPPDPDPDDLGLTAEQWYDLAFAYNHGLLEPEPGTVEDKAFGQMDRYTRQEVERVDATEAAEEAWRASRRGRAPQAGPEPEAGQ
jgi:hypothetical protein